MYLLKELVEHTHHMETLGFRNFYPHPLKYLGALGEKGCKVLIPISSIDCFFKKQQQLHLVKFLCRHRPRAYRGGIKFRVSHQQLSYNQK